MRIVTTKDIEDIPSGTILEVTENEQKDISHYFAIWSGWMGTKYRNIPKDRCEVIDYEEWD